MNHPEAVPDPPSRLARAIARFDAENAQDPASEMVAGRPEPRALLYARRLTEWVLRLDPQASEALQLAARSQHIRRWEIPRERYSNDRAGYHKWRNDLKRFHAEISRRILGECGYDEGMIEKVSALNLKLHFPGDPDSRTLEDALCLVFLEHQLGELAEKLDTEKVINALRKSWAKMTPRGREAAMKLPLDEPERHLLKRALESETSIHS